MRVLVTGHRGQVGMPVAAYLRDRGHQVAGFDRIDGADLLDLPALKRAAAGCAAIVHLGALAHDSAGSPDQIMAVNVLGTWHMLLAAEAAGAERIVHFSSAQVFGTAEGERLPACFPIDDSLPRLAMRPYGLSKRLTEDMCEGFTARTGIATVALRPVAVWGPDRCRQTWERWQADPRSEWDPYWEYGAFVDVRDVATAVEAALTAPLEGHHRVLLCAPDIAATARALEQAARLTPDVPVAEPIRYQADPWCALVDCTPARRILGWQAVHGWPYKR
jgi:UDP-glucose 4-epimerase